MKPMLKLYFVQYTLKKARQQIFNDDESAIYHLPMLLARALTKGTPGPAERLQVQLPGAAIRLRRISALICKLRSARSGGPSDKFEVLTAPGSSACMLR